MHDLHPRQAFTDRDQVDPCLGGLSCRAASILSRKNADGRLFAAAAALPRISGLPHDSADSHPGRRAASRPCVRLRQRLPGWMIAIGTSGRGPEGKAASGRMHQVLGRSAAAGEGTAIRVFRERQHRGGEIRMGRFVAAEVDACAGTSSTRSRSVRPARGGAPHGPARPIVHAVPRSPRALRVWTSVEPDGGGRMEVRQRSGAPFMTTPVDALRTHLATGPAQPQQEFTDD
jgi:hypothetical protein